MELDHVNLRAEPYFLEASCPKCRADMVQLKNGWFSVCWYCKKCKSVYHLRMTKTRKVNQENLDKILKEKGIV